MLASARVTAAARARPRSSRRGPCTHTRSGRSRRSRTGHRIAAGRASRRRACPTDSRLPGSPSWRCTSSPTKRGRRRPAPPWRAGRRCSRWPRPSCTRNLPRGTGTASPRAPPRRRLRSGTTRDSPAPRPRHRCAQSRGRRRLQASRRPGPPSPEDVASHTPARAASAHRRLRAGGSHGHLEVDQRVQLRLVTRIEHDRGEPLLADGPPLEPPAGSERIAIVDRMSSNRPSSFEVRARSRKGQRLPPRRPRPLPFCRPCVYTEPDGSV